jgi:hypothetical protein
MVKQEIVEARPDNLAMWNPQYLSEPPFSPEQVSAVQTAICEALGRKLESLGMEPGVIRENLGLVPIYMRPPDFKREPRYWNQLQGLHVLTYTPSDNRERDFPKRDGQVVTFDAEHSDGIIVTFSGVVSSAAPYSNLFLSSIERTTGGVHYFPGRYSSPGGSVRAVYDKDDRIRIGPKERRKKGGMAVALPVLIHEPSPISSKYAFTSIIVPPGYGQVFDPDGNMLNPDWRTFPQTPAELLAKELFDRPEEAVDRVMGIFQQKGHAMRDQEGYWGIGYIGGKEAKKVRIASGQDYIELTMVGLSKGLIRQARGLNFDALRQTFAVDDPGSRSLAKSQTHELDYKWMKRNAVDLTAGMSISSHGVPQDIIIGLAVGSENLASYPEFDLAEFCELVISLDNVRR